MHRFPHQREEVDAASLVAYGLVYCAEELHAMMSGQFGPPLHSSMEDRRRQYRPDPAYYPVLNFRRTPGQHRDQIREQPQGERADHDRPSRHERKSRRSASSEPSPSDSKRRKRRSRKATPEGGKGNKGSDSGSESDSGSSSSSSGDDSSKGGNDSSDGEEKTQEHEKETEEKGRVKREPKAKSTTEEARKSEFRGPHPPGSEGVQEVLQDPRLPRIGGGAELAVWDRISRMMEVSPEQRLNMLSKAGVDLANFPSGFAAHFPSSLSTNGTIRLKTESDGSTSSNSGSTWRRRTERDKDSPRPMNLSPELSQSLLQQQHSESAARNYADSLRRLMEASGLPGNLPASMLDMSVPLPPAVRPATSASSSSLALSSNDSIPTLSALLGLSPGLPKHLAGTSQFTGIGVPPLTGVTSTAAASAAFAPNLNLNVNVHVPSTTTTIAPSTTTSTIPSQLLHLHHHYHHGSPNGRNPLWSSPARPHPQASPSPGILGHPSTSPSPSGSGSVGGVSLVNPLAALAFAGNSELTERLLQATQGWKPPTTTAAAAAATAANATTSVIPNPTAAAAAAAAAIIGAPVSPPTSSSSSAGRSFSPPGATHTPNPTRSPTHSGESNNNNNNNINSYSNLIPNIPELLQRLQHQTALPVQSGSAWQVHFQNNNNNNNNSNNNTATSSPFSKTPHETGLTLTGGTAALSSHVPPAHAISASVSSSAPPLSGSPSRSTSVASPHNLGAAGHSGFSSFSAPQAQALELSFLAALSRQQQQQQQQQQL